jgi:signal transduction histidine kinase
VAAASAEPEAAKTSFGLPEGFAAEAWAAEPLLANPVAFSIDEQGKAYVCEAFRAHKGVGDNVRINDDRWLDADLANDTVDERFASMVRILGKKAKDWVVETDRLRRVVDTDGDGRGDTATVFATGFNRLIDGHGAGVLARRGDVFYACIPHLWRFRDADGDGVADEKLPLHVGYGVRTAIQGHDLHGLTLGPDGRLWFSTAKGVVIVDPKHLPVNAVAPAVAIDELQVDGTLVAADGNNPLPQNAKSAIRILGSKPGPLPSSEVTIGPGARRVEIRYAALSFTAPEKVRFRYRLDRLNADWVDAGGRRVADFPYLPPGQYQFRVMACNEDLVWSEREAVLALTCRPAFWQTGGFRLLATLLVLGACGWAVKLLATRRLQRRLSLSEQQHALEQERTRIARDIHDELGTLLTGISLLSDRAQAHRDRAEQVGEHLEKISQRARSAVQTVDGIVWAINPQNDTLDNLANYLVQFAEDFFRLTPIRCRLDVPAEVPQLPLGTQQRHHILLAVKEACNNVARHSGASEVWVRLAAAASSLCITIEDNGRGFVAGTVSEGSDGLRNMRQRLAEVGGRLELASEPGKGTSVKLVAPLFKSKPNPCPSA